jgi:hypothetical protein
VALRDLANVANLVDIPAKALGLAVPPSILLRATEVIE